MFEDMGERQRSVDSIKTDLQQFYQGIERMITKKLDGIENIVETKISNMMETIANNKNLNQKSECSACNER